MWLTMIVDINIRLLMVSHSYLPHMWPQAYWGRGYTSHAAKYHVVGSFCTANQV